MKSWTVAEISNVVALLKPLVGLRLQEVQTSAQDVVLGFYAPEGVLWLWIDLNAVSPGMLPWGELPFRPGPAKKTPMQIFLRSHFVGRALREASISSTFGRVVHLEFGSEDGPLELEVRLLPHGRNILATSGKKHIAWQKPQVLSANHEHPVQHAAPRILDELREQWLATRRKGTKKSPVDGKARLQSDLEKKRKALAKVSEELERKQTLPWRQIGDWLKANQSLAVEKEWQPFVDSRRKLAWNIEQCYKKAREAEGKIFGTEKRLVVLQEEIAGMEKRLASGQVMLEPPPSSGKLLPSMTDMQAQGRTLKLSADITVIAGKSAADNMKILRKARAWDLWFHLRDYPSSHAVLFRNKNVKVGEALLHEVGQWFLRTHFGAKAKQHAGEKFTLMVCECRHVRPIKGDKIGRVTYRDERVFICALPR